MGCRGADNMQKSASATPMELAHVGSLGSDSAGPTSAELAPKASSSGKLLKAMTADLKDILATSGKGSRSPDRCMTGSLRQHCLPACQVTHPHLLQHAPQQDRSTSNDIMKSHLCKGRKGVLLLELPVTLMSEWHSLPCSAAEALSRSPWGMVVLLPPLSRAVLACSSWRRAHHL